MKTKQLKLPNLFSLLFLILMYACNKIATEYNNALLLQRNREALRVVRRVFGINSIHSRVL